MEYRSLRNWKYQLTKNEFYATGIELPSPIETDFLRMESNGNLTIYKFYAWDGATGYPDFKDIMRASLIHDALCQLINEGFIHKDNRKAADKILKKICLEDGMLEAEAQIVYNAVRAYAQSKGYA